MQMRHTCVVCNQTSGVGTQKQLPKEYKVRLILMGERSKAFIRFPVSASEGIFVSRAGGWLLCARLENPPCENDTEKRSESCPPLPPPPRGQYPVKSFVCKTLFFSTCFFFFFKYSGVLAFCFVSMCATMAQQGGGEEGAAMHTETC